MNVFPDIDEYAFLSDGETNALVAPSGQVEWLCVPRPDSASIFGAVLDRSAGLFGLGRSPAARKCRFDRVAVREDLIRSGLLAESRNR